jgi:hypothetical protein
MNYAFDLLVFDDLRVLGREFKCYFWGLIFFGFFMGLLLKRGALYRAPLYPLILAFS